MKTYLTLLLTLVKVNFSLVTLKHAWRRDLRKRWQMAGIGLLIALGVIPLLWTLLGLVRLLHGALSMGGHEDLIITISLLSAQMLIFLLGLFYLLAAFYMAHDRETLLALPLKPGHVLGAKFSLVMINEYLTTLPLLLPILITFGLLEGVGMAYWLMLVPLLLLLPVLPLALSALLLVILMRFVNLGRHKDKLIVIGALSLMGLSFFVQLRLSQGHLDGQQVVAALSAEDGLVNWLGARFPLALWGTRMLQHPGEGTGWSSGLLFVGSSLLVAALFILVGSKLYYSGLIGIGDTARSTRVRGQLILGGGRHPLRALWLREWRVMNRVPMFLLNGSLAVLFVPVLLGVMLRFNGNLRSDPMFSMLLSRAGSTAILAAAAFLVVCASFNGIASTAISREGGRFWLSKVIPVSPIIQAGAKLLHAMTLGTVGLTAGSLSLVFALGLSFDVLLPAILLAFPAMAAFAVIGLCIDLMRPKLHWTSPQAAIKQNMNAFLSTLFQMLVLVGLGFLYARLRGYGWGSTSILLGYGAFFLLLFAAGWTFLATKVRKRYTLIVG
jgi:ABC-2 type transport system permease protein